jgi:hypothetical protein
LWIRFSGEIYFSWYPRKISNKWDNRVDIEFALYNGTTTQFHIKDVPGQILSELRTTMCHNKEQQIVNFQFTKLLSPDLQDVLSDILILACVLNNHENVPMKLNAYSCQQIVILVSYRLIQISQLATPRLASDLENMIHLSLTAFTTTLFLGFGSAALKAPLLVKLLRELAQRFQAHDAETKKVLLWVLFMGRASVFNDLGDWWIVPKIREIRIDLNLRTCEDVRNILSRFPWVDSVHGQSGRALWEKSEDNCILLS